MTTYNLNFINQDVISDSVGLVPGCLGWLQMNTVDSNPAGGSATALIYFYKDLPHFLTGTNPVCVKKINLNSQEVLAIAGSTPPPNTIVSAYLLQAYFNAALTHLTVDTGTVDSNGNPVFKSDFYGATIITVPVTT